MIKKQLIRNFKKRGTRPVSEALLADAQSVAQSDRASEGKY